MELKNGFFLIENEKPAWIRPVCKTKHGEIPTYLVPHIKLLDIVDLESAEKIPFSYQSENVLFNPASLRVVGAIPSHCVAALYNNQQSFLFGCKNKAVEEEHIHTRDHSLTMIEIPKANFCRKTYADSEKSQLRIVFIFNKYEYDLPVTDPSFLDFYKRNKDLTAHAEKIFLVLSLGILYQSWHYKLVAGIIY